MELKPKCKRHPFPTFVCWTAVILCAGISPSIRDRFSPLLRHYIRLRAESSQPPWKKLAEQVGLTKAQLTEIETTITTQREALIQKEYDYATSQYGIIDSSPTYVWESERVPNLRKIEAFRGLDRSPQEACSR